MATTNKLTNAIALNAAIAAFKDMDANAVIDGFTAEEYTTKFEKMLETATKKHASTNSETPEQRKNREEYIPAMLKAMAAQGEPITSKWVSDNVRGITTTQKATALLTKCVKNGVVVRIQEGRKVVFALAGNASTTN